jgi:hypothetical protein
MAGRSTYRDVDPVMLHDWFAWLRDDAFVRAVRLKHAPRREAAVAKRRCLTLPTRTKPVLQSGK